jgi:pyruvate formate lyase activating enzyme
MIRVGGLVPLSATDYPDHLAAVVFCQGCAWRCGYCHNPHLLPRRGEREIAWKDVLTFLQRRRGLLDAVVFSGGEPTLQPALPDALRTVKALGYKTGLHTAGIHPQRLGAALPLLDWVGMDVKAPFDRYGEVTGVPGSGNRARRSLERVLASGVPYEIRTTADPASLTLEVLESTAATLIDHGARHYVLQACRPRGDCDGAHSALAARLATRFDSFRMRGY